MSSSLDPIMSHRHRRRCRATPLILCGAAWLVAAPVALRAQESSLRPSASRAQQAALAARADSLHATAESLIDGGAAGARAAAGLLREEIGLQSRLGRMREAASAWNTLGHALMELQLPDSALLAYRRSLDLRRTAREPTGGSTNNIANAFRSLGRLDSAIVYYRRAIALHRAAQSRQSEAMSLRNLALAQADSAPRDAAQRDSAIASLGQAIAVHRALAGDADDAEFAQALVDLAAVQDDAGALEAAGLTRHEALGRAIGSGDRAREGALLFDIATVHHRLDRPDSAVAYYSRAADVAARQGDSPAQADALRRVGDVHAVQGRTVASLAAYDSALQAARAVADSTRIADILVDRGYELMAAGHLDSALSAIVDARVAAAGAGARAGRARAAAAHAAWFVRTGQDDSSRVMLREELALHEAAGDTTAQILALLRLIDALGNRTPGNAAMLADSSRRVLGQVVALAAVHGTPALRARVAMTRAYAMLNRRMQDSARAFALEAYYLAGAAGDRARQASALRVIALTHAEPDSISHHAARAVALADSARSPTMARAIHFAIGERFMELAQPDGAAPEHAERALAHLGRALALARATGDPASEADALQSIGIVYRWWRPARYAEAAAYFDSTWHVQEGMRRRAGGDAARVAFAEEHGNTARRLADAWDARAAQTGDQADRRRSLAAVERGRARSLLDLMGDDGHAALDGSLDAIADRLIAAAARPGVATLTYTIGIDTLYAKLLLPSGHIAAFQVAGGSDSVQHDAALLRRALDVDSAAVRAVNGSLEPSDTRGIGVRTGEAAAISLDSALARVARHALPPAMRDRLERERIAELVIITDAEVAAIPFAALPFDSAGTPLGQRLRLRFAPSFALLAAGDVQPSGGARRALVVGDPAMPTVRTAAGDAVRLDPLPGAGAEAASVARRLRAPVLAGAAATEAVVRAALPAASVVHLATHGYAYAAADRVRDSFIALAPGAGEDGLLTVGEVLDHVPRMVADLVVLSACQTGLGTTSYTEGTLGLQRAFLAKGARSLLVSLWSVNDAVTKLLMERFYAHWTGGASKAEALRRAQADVRKAHPNPRYWAAFQLVGGG